MYTLLSCMHRSNSLQDKTSDTMEPTIRLSPTPFFSSDAKCNRPNLFQTEPPNHKVEPLLKAMLQTQDCVGNTPFILSCWPFGSIIILASDAVYLVDCQQVEVSMYTLFLHVLYRLSALKKEQQITMKDIYTYS